MPTPDHDHVQEILARNGRDLKIREAIGKAWADVQAKYPDRAWFRRASTVRALMWEHSVDRVMGVVGDDEGLASVQHHDTATFIADDSVLFRLKKADRKLSSSNYPTTLASLFHQHDADLFGHRGFQRVEIVHTFNRYFTALNWIGVVARDEGKTIWSFELRRHAGEGEVIPFPAIPKGPAGGTVVRPIIPDADEAGDKEV
ncbi:hypothetical protein [Sphingopyxis alaskensis]|uniref:hypothetical protein n=1 Tax=Sphingopyxis alaskensis TaxID=117207 RepID=UPI003918EC24